MSWQAFVSWLTNGQVDRGAARDTVRRDAFPNVPLVDQFGRMHRFHDDFVAPGNAIIVNSMYTTCRGSCPGTSMKLFQLRKQLWPVFGPKLTILSFTLEPLIDTPEVLREYAATYSADVPNDHLGDWFFLTGEPRDIETLRHGLVFYDLDPKVDRDPKQHASLLFYGNATTDRWAATPSELPLARLAESIRRVAGFTFEQRYGFSPDARREIVSKVGTVK